MSEPTMSHKQRALELRIDLEAINDGIWYRTKDEWKRYETDAQTLIVAAFAAVASETRVEALEQAAQVADRFGRSGQFPYDIQTVIAPEIAKEIRQLGVKP